MTTERKHLQLFAFCSPIVAIIACVAFMPSVAGLLASWGNSVQERPSSSAASPARAELSPGKGDQLRLPVDVVQTLGVGVGTVEKSRQPRVVALSGSLALDANHLVRVHTRFGGEVVEISSLPHLSPSASSSGQSPLRQVQVGDKVVKGQLLATIWSKDLGEKKSELVDALAQLRMSRERFDKLEEGFQRQAIPEASIRQARRDLEGDLNAVSRAERTLRVWRLSDTEIDAIKVEYERIRQRQGKRDKDKEREWARVEVRAPFDGVVLERNVALGDIVDTSTDLFKIADLNRLTVWAYAFENQLPDLVNLPTPVPWNVRLKADPDAKSIVGHVEMIGSIVDPTQHTALIRGSVENIQGKLRAGQFITAVVELPPPADEVVIPIAALIEDGRESVVFVQPSSKESCYSQRRVKITRRGHDLAHVCNQLSQAEEEQGFKVLRPGEQVVTSGGLAMKAALGDLQTLAKKKTETRLVQR